MPAFDHEAAFSLVTIALGSGQHSAAKDRARPALAYIRDHYFRLLNMRDAYQALVAKQGPAVIPLKDSLPRVATEAMALKSDSDPPPPNVSPDLQPPTALEPPAGISFDGTDLDPSNADRQTQCPMCGEPGESDPDAGRLKCASCGYTWTRPGTEEHGARSGLIDLHNLAYKKQRSNVAWSWEVCVSAAFDDLRALHYATQVSFSKHPSATRPKELPCVGCDSPDGDACRALWSQQRKCCPDCSHLPKDNP